MKKKGPDIILYHFCALKDVGAIRREGLTLGLTPILTDGKAHFERPTQWLTKDKNPDNQSWAEFTLVPYSRTEFRLTIRIPYSRRKKLVQAHEFIKCFPPENLGLVEGWAGSENWYVYCGKIPPGWITGAGYNVKEGTGSD